MNALFLTRIRTSPGSHLVGSRANTPNPVRGLLLPPVRESADALHRETGLFERCAKHGDRAPIIGINELAQEASDLAQLRQPRFGSAFQERERA